MRSLAALLLLLAGGAPALAAKTPVPATVAVPDGPFVEGSSVAQREYAYQLDEAAYSHSRTREAEWYEGEAPPRSATTDAFAIMTNLVTNADYARFVEATGYPAPDVDRTTWAGYGLVHPFERTRRFAWTGGSPPEGREDHPVVRVSHDDAKAYAAWLSQQTGQIWRLAEAHEWEKAARGEDGRTFPWGDAWDPALLNSADQGPFDTLPVGSFPDGASPFGMLDAAGQVFEWTATAAGEGRYVVKGGSWDDKGCGVCRSAAGHTRPEDLEHILTGARDRLTRRSARGRASPSADKKSEVEGSKRRARAFIVEGEGGILSIGGSGLARSRPLEGAPGWRVIERQRRSWPAGYVIVPIALVVGSLQVLIPSASDRGGWSQDRHQASPSDATSSTADGAIGAPQAGPQPQTLPESIGRSAQRQGLPLPNPTPLASSAGLADEATAVGAAPTRVLIHHPVGTQNAIPAIQLAAYLLAHGFAVTDIRAVDSHIEQPSVRYFFERDQPDSDRLVEAIGAFFAKAPGLAPHEAINLSHLSPKPQQGNIEVWLPDPRDDEMS
jgi:formylglycine-generating enzyme required for sulfatase activity